MGMSYRMMNYARQVNLNLRVRQEFWQMKTGLTAKIEYANALTTIVAPLGGRTSSLSHSQLVFDMIQTNKQLQQQSVQDEFNRYKQEADRFISVQQD